MALALTSVLGGNSSLLALLTSLEWATSAEIMCVQLLNNLLVWHTSSDWEDTSVLIYLKCFIKNYLKHFLIPAC